MTLPEKSTNQLTVWRELLDALNQVTAAWDRTQTMGPHTTGTTQLPANIANALAKALGNATHAVAGATEALAAQHDSGTRYASASDALRAAAVVWPS